MFGLSNFIITEFLLIFYLLVTNVLYSYNKTSTSHVICMSVEVFLCSKRFFAVFKTLLLYLKCYCCIQNTFSLFESFRSNICTVLHTFEVNMCYPFISSIERRSKVFTKTYYAKNSTAI